MRYDNPFYASFTQTVFFETSKDGRFSLGADVTFHERTGDVLAINWNIDEPTEEEEKRLDKLIEQFGVNGYGGKPTCYKQDYLDHLADLANDAKNER